MACTYFPFLMFSNCDVPTCHGFDMAACGVTKLQKNVLVTML